MRKGRLPAVVAAVLVTTLVLAPAVWAVPGTPISNVLEATLTEEVKAQPTITVHDDLSDTSIVGLWDVFSVSTTPGDYEGETVRVKIELNQGTANGFELEYYDPDDDTFKPLPFAGSVAWFGPAGGFPLGEATSVFRVTWKQPGTYATRISIMSGSNFTEELASTSSQVEVAAAGNAIRLDWTDGDGNVLGDRIDRNYTVGEAFQMSAQASLDSDVTHVDGVLYIIKVNKGSDTATPDDLIVTGTGGQALGYRDGYFYWGPSTGFTFGCVDGVVTGPACQQAPANTTFTVTVRSGGTYSVRAHAVQLDPEDAGIRFPGD